MLALPSPLLYLAFDFSFSPGQSLPVRVCASGLSNRELILRVWQLLSLSKDLLSPSADRLIKEPCAAQCRSQSLEFLQIVLIVTLVCQRSCNLFSASIRCIFCDYPATMAEVESKEFKEYFMIVELESAEEDEYCQLIMISNKHVRNMETVNPDTCYTGKQIELDLAGEIKKASISTISADFEYVRAQFRYLQEQKESAESFESEQAKMSPKSDAGANSPEPNRCSVESPVPSTSAGPSTSAAQRGAPMTFNQQTQTDDRMGGEDKPATSSQMDQNMQQMGRLLDHNAAIRNHMGDLHRNQMDLNNKYEACNFTLSQVLRRVQMLEDAVAQVRRVQEQLMTPRENSGSILLEVSPVTSSPSSDNAVLNETELQMETIERVTLRKDTLPALKTYSTPRASKCKSPPEFNDENECPNPKRRKTPQNSGRSSSDFEYQHEEDVVIGPNGTTVPAQMVKSMNWACYSLATRRILVHVFGRKILSTHSLSGKASPAFQDRTPKDPLNPLKVLDIVQFVAKNANVPESNVRSIVTAKCADENKIVKAKREKARLRRLRMNNGGNGSSGDGSSGGDGSGGDGSGGDGSSGAGCSKNLV